jgi:RNA polymerase sigma-70 factor (ECF subfamily)
MAAADPGADTEQWLNQARAGDRGAMTRLLEAHEPQIYRFALRMCDRPEDARDVLQETLLAAFRGLGEFRGEAKLSTWLFQIARSFCSKSARLRMGEPRVMQPLTQVAEQPSEARDPEAAAHAREVGAVLQLALAALPAHHREVLLLKDVEGLLAEEVAAVVGESLAATKSRLHRARLELRHLLEGVLDDGVPPVAPCPELADVLSGYAAGDIDQQTCERMEAHMARCRQCAQTCDSLKRTVQMCSRAGGEEVPVPIRAAIRQALQLAV